MIQSLLDVFFPKRHDEMFAMLLQREFWSDLRAAVILRSLSQHGLTNNQDFLLNMLREKYSVNGSCPSTLFPNVSKHLQDNYWGIHDQICSALYK